MPLEVIELSKRHDRKTFDCGSESLNRFLQNSARQQTERNLSRTWVLVSSDAPTGIIGFHTLAISELDASAAIKRYQNYPHPLPVVRLARLAIDTAHQRQGYGQLLMMDAMQKTVTISDAAGLTGMVVDAKDAAAQAYYTQFGFMPLQHQQKACALFLPIQTCRQVLK